MQRFIGLVVRKLVRFAFLIAILLIAAGIWHLDGATARYLMDRTASLWHAQPFDRATSNLDLAERQVFYFLGRVAATDADPQVGVAEKELAHLQLKRAEDSRDAARAHLVEVRFVRQALDGSLLRAHDRQVLSTENSNLKAKLEEFRIAAKAAEAREAQPDPVKEAQGRELDSQRVEIADLRTRLSDSVDAARRANAKVTELSEAVAQRDGQLRQLKRLDSENTDLTARLAASTESAKRAETTASQLQGSVSSLQRQTEELRSQAQALARDRDDWRTRAETPPVASGTAEIPQTWTPGTSEPTVTVPATTYDYTYPPVSSQGPVVRYHYQYHPAPHGSVRQPAPRALAAPPARPAGERRR